MSKTPVSDPKITQMLDAGWKVELYKGGMGDYVATAHTQSEDAWRRARQNWDDMLKNQSEPISESLREVVVNADFEHEPDGFSICTSDWTPSQTLTRLAYKVHGEYLPDGNEETQEPQQ